MTELKQDKKVKLPFEPEVIFFTNDFKPGRDLRVAELQYFYMDSEWLVYQEWGSLDRKAVPVAHVAFVKCK